MNISGGDYLDKPVLDQYGEGVYYLFADGLAPVRAQGGCDKGVVDGR